MQKKFLLIFFLCGMLSSLPYTFSFLFMISWISFIPMIFILTKYGSKFGKRYSYLLGMCFGLGYYGVTYHWFTSLYPLNFQGLTPLLNIALVAVCWTALTLIHSLEFGAVTLLYSLLTKKVSSIPLRALTFPSLFIIFEWQQNLFWRGVPWLRLAVTQADALPILQSASLFGNLFISFIIMLCNALLCIAIIFAVPNFHGASFRAKLLNMLKPMSVRFFALSAVAVFILNLAFGAARLAVYDEKSGEKITVGVIQSNIPSQDIWDYPYLNSVIEYHLNETEKCVNETGASIVVWPETVVPLSLNRYYEISSRISAYAKKLNVNIFVGALAMNTNEQTNEKFEQNALYLFRSDGTVDENRYYKQKLVPFGEFTPMEDIILTLFPVLDVLSLLSDPLVAGNSSNVFSCETTNIGALICFDTIYSQLTINSVRDGAELIIIATNDAWFDESANIFQHSTHATLRAIESGRYVARSANRGISSIISPTGRYISSLQPLTEGYAAADVYTSSKPTLYSIVGDLIVYLNIGAICCGCAYKLTKNLKRPQK